MKKEVIILGAGPAGLSAAHRLSEKGIYSTIIDKENAVGGMSRTIKKEGNFFDLGGHRFFTKSKEVNKLWQETLGLDFRTVDRTSRIYYNNLFFNYPISIKQVYQKLGLAESIKITISFLLAKLSLNSEPDNYEEWIVKRFGRRLYNHFFKEYTHKLWGIPGKRISKVWAGQRIKELSFIEILRNNLGLNKKVAKTLIPQFRFPKYGAGMMYEKMLQNTKNTKLILNTKVSTINHDNLKIISVNIDKKEIRGTDFISSIPISEFVQNMNPLPPKEVLESARKLRFRSFILLGLVLNPKNHKITKDNWIYIQSKNLKLGRIQVFNNWSPDMARSPSELVLGLEFFCNEGDDFWNLRDKNIQEIGITELRKLNILKDFEIIDFIVTRVPDAYPIMDLEYEKNLQKVREYLSKFENLQMIGRGGMFRYNNMDHSIITGLLSVENLFGSNHNLWEVNEDEEYHES